MQMSKKIHNESPVAGYLGEMVEMRFAIRINLKGRMKQSKTLTGCSFALAVFMSVNTALAGQSCCVRAKAKGKECDHECCVKAHREHKLCEKCQKDTNNCCDRAIAQGKECPHSCCKEAAKEHKICEKCNKPEENKGK